MITLSRRLIISCALALSITIPAKPLGETTATALSVAGGVVVGGIVGAGTYYKTDSLIISGLAGACAGGLTWYLLNEWLYSKTPTARVAAASLLVSTAVRNIQAIEQDLNTSFADKVVSKKFASDTDFVANVNARFGTSWPLVLAREYLTNLPGGFSSRVASVKGLVAAAQDPLNTALIEMRSGTGYGHLIAEAERLNDAIKQIFIQCNQVQSQIQALAGVIESPLMTIVQHEKFDFQVDLYEKHLEAERQRRHAEEEARRQRQHQLALQSNDHSHDSWERQRDRYGNARENERKYQHQDDILRRNNNRPVTLNVG